MLHYYWNLPETFNDLGGVKFPKTKERNKERRMKVKSKEEGDEERKKERKEAGMKEWWKEKRKSGSITNYICPQ